MLIEVRRAMAKDISRVLKFYAGRRYGGGIRPEDALLLAEHDGELIGIVRLTQKRAWLCCAECRFTRGFNAREPGKDSWRLSPKSWMAEAVSASLMRISSVSMAESDSTRWNPRRHRPFSGCGWRSIETGAMGPIISSCAAKVSKKLLTWFAPTPVGYRKFHDHVQTIRDAPAACL
jgi:hypothetical protein